MSKIKMGTETGTGTFYSTRQFRVQAVKRSAVHRGLDLVIGMDMTPTRFQLELYIKNELSCVNLMLVIIASLVCSTSND